MSDAQLLLFIVTSLVVIVTPGQDMILVMSRSITQGSAAGIATAAGVSTGLLGHTLLAGLGLGSILLVSETLFVVLKLVGAAYLIYLGVRLLLTRAASLELAGPRAARRRRLFVEGALSNLSNPKIAIFYFAFLPQFMPADTQHPTQLLLMLGAVFSAPHLPGERADRLLRRCAFGVVARAGREYSSACTARAARCWLHSG